MDGGETKRHNSEELKAENVNSFAVDSAKIENLIIHQTPKWLLAMGCIKFVPSLYYIPCTTLFLMKFKRIGIYIVSCQESFYSVDAPDADVSIN